jgi:hypothetical protein
MRLFTTCLVVHAIAALLLLPFCERAWAQRVGHWKAYSRTATGITGDITISPSAVLFEGGRQLHITYLDEHRGITLEPGDPLAKLYQIDAPTNASLRADPELCGKLLHPTFLAIIERDVSPYELMMMGAVHGTSLRTLSVSALTGSSVPGAHGNRNRVCASFGYVRYEARTN